MKFKPIRMRFDPERKTGSIELLETINGHAVGDTSIDFPISKDGCKRIMSVLREEADLALQALKE